MSIYFNKFLVILFLTQQVSCVTLQSRTGILLFLPLHSFLLQDSFFVPLPQPEFHKKGLQAHRICNPLLSLLNILSSATPHNVSFFFRRFSYTCPEIERFPLPVPKKTSGFGIPWKSLPPLSNRLNSPATCAASASFSSL